MRRYLLAGVVTVVGFWSTAVPAHAQARGSAEASAAAVANPKWTPPKTAWGHPDLEGIWTSDDMRGVPMSRSPQFGNRRFLTDEEFAQRARERGTARDFGAYEKQAAENAAKGLPPPERVFERVNGADRGR